MAPMLNNFDEETCNLIGSLERRQRDIVDFQIPRLRSCKGPLATQQTLSAELREDTNRLSHQIETLDVLVDDQKGEKNRRELRLIVDEFQATLARVRQDTRAALLTSKRAIDSQSSSQREELLRASAANEKQNIDENRTDDALMKANDDVTESLRRTIALMQGELERSVLTSQMLDASTTTLRSTSSQHDALNSFMFTSKQLITALEKSDWLDRLLIFSAFSFFLLVILFILKQRFIDRGMRMALWWTRFLPKQPVRELEKGVSAIKEAMTVSAVLSDAIPAAQTLVSTPLISSDSTTSPLPERTIIEL